MLEKVIEQKLYIWHFDGNWKLNDTYGIWATDDEDFEEKLKRQLDERYPSDDNDISDIPYWVLMDINYNQVTRNIVLVKEVE